MPKELKAHHYLGLIAVAGVVGYLIYRYNQNKSAGATANFVNATGSGFDWRLPPTYYTMPANYGKANTNYVIDPGTNYYKNMTCAQLNQCLSYVNSFGIYTPPVAAAGQPAAPGLTPAQLYHNDTLNAYKITLHGLLAKNCGPKSVPVANHASAAMAGGSSWH